MSYRRGDVGRQALQLGLSYVPVVGGLLSQLTGLLPTETPGIFFGDAGAQFRAWQSAQQAGMQANLRARQMADARLSPQSRLRLALQRLRSIRRAQMRAMNR